MTTDDLIIARCDTARVALREATSAPQAKQIKDVARAAKDYATRQQLSREIVVYALEIEREAEALMGQFLKSTPKNEGKLRRGPAVPEGNSGDVPRLDEIGITRKESARAQFVAQVREDAPEKFEDYKHGKKSFAALKRESRNGSQPERKRKPKKRTDATEPADIVNDLIAQLWGFIDELLKSWPAETEISYFSNGLRQCADGLERKEKKKRRTA